MRSRDLRSFESGIDSVAAMSALKLVSWVMSASWNSHRAERHHWFECISSYLGMKTLSGGPCLPFEMDVPDVAVASRRYCPTRIQSDLEWRVRFRCSHVPTYSESAQQSGALPPHRDVCHVPAATLQSRNTAACRRIRFRKCVQRLYRPVAAAAVCQSRVCCG